MIAPHSTDLNLAASDISALASVEAVAGFLAKLGFDTSARKSLTPEAIGLAGDSAAAIKQIEILSEDPEGFLRVVFVQLRSLTARSRYDLARVLGKANVDHLLVLTSDFSTIEFVLLDKRRRDHRGPGGVQRIQVVPLAFAVPRKSAGTRELRTVRRFSWTSRDGLEQFDKLRSVFEAAAFSEDYFCNRALFADHYLLTRLREDAAWSDNPTQPFQQVKEHLRDARQRWLGKGEEIVRRELFQPIFSLLGLTAKANKAADDDQTKPDYLLAGSSGKPLTAAFVYAWDRWLDGPDFNNDQHTPDENPGASVVTALEEGVADWIIVTNGRQWRLYSRHAHSRATNFYEVDLPEALVASGDTDPNEAFRYWWLFFRAGAFAIAPSESAGCWLDTVAAGSRDYAKTLGQRLKERVFITIFPHLAQGFLEDRRTRLGAKGQSSEQELRDTFEATLTLLYRLLFLLYAEARDLLPIREAPYREASLKKVKDEIAEAAGVAESEVDERLKKAYGKADSNLYDRLQRLFAAMDQGNPTLNVPTYNGGLFITDPEKPSGSVKTDDREQRIARFLLEHKVPDRFLALAIDHLSRDPDEKTFKLVQIDYKSLEVRHLGSIYEGLLEFKLRVAADDLTTKSEKGKEKFIPLTEAKSKRGRAAEVVVGKGAVYLSNDKAERKASGSYYTPDPIVEYIVEHTVGPVLDEKLEALRADFRKVRKTFDNEVQKATAFPVRTPTGESRDPREFAAEKTYAAHRDLVERMFEFRTLDPAMGSGHFLVEAVDFITDRLLTFLNQFPVNPVAFMLERTRRNILEALGEQGVTVDPDKLTDINLLKRHVLKRCIYGVDLNPMAVELAKVSLWLDAFTLGAPLSFLDHHLRCGNSLIGATFDDLKRAIAKRPLNRIDYAPLTEAIRQVIESSKQSDATIEEVKISSSFYHLARENLSGYTLVFDLLTAKYFGYDDAPNLVIDAAPSLTIDGPMMPLTNREAFLASLHDATERNLVQRVEAVAKQSDRRFFHWEIEFPEVFFGFADADERHLKHKNDIVAGSAGFDAVVGNPPYVRVELLESSIKSYLKSHYQSVLDRCDIYVAFVESAFSRLRSFGRAGAIVSNQFFNTDYGKSLRQVLAGRRAVVRLLDLSPLQVFDGALTYPAIIVISATPQNTLRVLAMEAFAPEPPHQVPDEVIFSMHSNEDVQVASASLYSRDVWSAAALIDTASPLTADGVRLVELGTVCNISSSMKSGKDEVLVGKVVEETQRYYVLHTAVCESPFRVERVLWRPVIRPKDLGEDRVQPPSRVVFWPYSDSSDDGFVLLPETDLRRTCTATMDYLSRHQHELEGRRDSRKTWKEHGRPWYSLARIGKPSDYQPPKLLSPGEFKSPRFVLSEDTSLFPCARIIGISSIHVPAKALQAFVQSEYATAWFRQNLPAKGGGFRGMSVGDLAKLPVPHPTSNVWEAVANATNRKEVDGILRVYLT